MPAINRNSSPFAQGIMSRRRQNVTVRNCLPLPAMPMIDFESELR